jgi:hypothetical protein
MRCQPASLRRTDRVRQRGGICGVVEVAIGQAAMVAIVVGTASIVGGVSLGLTRFRGHSEVFTGGVPDARNPSTLFA